MHMTTDFNFEEEVLKATKPVLVDCWAEWCGPCRSLMPVLEELEPEYKDKVLFMKINIDENPEVPSQYGVMSIPTLMLFKNGQLIASRVGGLSKAQLSAWIDDQL